MIIGVDAGMLGISDERLQVGVWRDAVNLLEVLGKIDTTNQYRLYSFYPIPKEQMERFGPNMENRVLRPKKGWFRFALPLELLIHPVSVFIGLAQAVPSTFSRKIGFIYDLGFLHEPQLYPGTADRHMDHTKSLIARSDVIVTISNAMKSDIITTFGVDPTSIVVCPLGVSSIFSAKGEVHKEDYPYFLFVGSLKKSKNVPGIVKAFGKFHKRSKKSYKLVMVGSDYWFDPEIHKVIKDESLEDFVAIKGFVPDKKLAAMYRGATALITPSLVEGFCLPALEAMASRCPVIGSTIPAISELVGNAGIFVDPRDVDSIADALSLIARNQKLVHTMINKGEERAALYTWESTAHIVRAIL